MHDGRVVVGKSSRVDKLRVDLLEVFHEHVGHVVVEDADIGVAVLARLWKWWTVVYMGIVLVFSASEEQPLIKSYG